jgi:hypothetical protein
MKSIPTRSKFLSLLLTVLLVAVTGYLIFPALPQTRERIVAPSPAEATAQVADTIKTDVDLVTVDALVMQKNTSRFKNPQSSVPFPTARL